MRRNLEGIRRECHRQYCTPIAYFCYLIYCLNYVHHVENTTVVLSEIRTFSFNAFFSFLLPLFLLAIKLICEVTLFISIGIGSYSSFFFFFFNNNNFNNILLSHWYNCKCS